jgi:hypothetical protein
VNSRGRQRRGVDEQLKTTLDKPAPTITQIHLLHKTSYLQVGSCMPKWEKLIMLIMAPYSVHFFTARPGYRPLIKYNTVNSIFIKYNSKTSKLRLNTMLVKPAGLIKNYFSKLLLSDQQSRYVSRDMLVLRTSASTLISSTQHCCP